MSLQSTFGVWVRIFVFAVLAAPMPLKADEWLIINPLQIELLAGFDGYRRESGSGTSDRYRWEAGVRLEQEVYIYHPAILTVRYALEPRYMWGELSVNELKEDTDDEFLGYHLGIDILKDSVLPVDGLLIASQSSTVNTGSLGRRTEADIQLLQAYMNWYLQPFPIRFLLEERSVKSRKRSATGSAVALRDDTERIFTIQGESSKLYTLYEWRSLDDNVPGRNNDFDINRLSVRHLFSWGRGSDLTSRVELWDRTGFNAYERREWSQFSRLFHMPSLYSNLGYSLSSQTQSVTTDRQTVHYRLVHNLYRNLNTRAGMILERRDSPKLLEKRRQIDLNVSYNKSGLWGMNVGMSIGGSLGSVVRDSDAGFFEIVDEAYTVPLNGLIILNTRFIVIQTIVVTSARSPIVYEEGLDYEVAQLADGLTRMTILPAGRIETGETILVSYKAAILPSVEFDRTSRTSAINLGFRGFSFIYRNDAVDHDVTSGEGIAPLDTKNQTTGVYYSWNRNRLSVYLGVERRFSMIGDYEETTDTASESFSFRATSRTNINLNFTQSVTETLTRSVLEFIREDIKLYAGNLSISWKPHASLAINPSVGAWKRDVDRSGSIDQTSDDTILSASLGINWNFRKLSMSLYYNHNDRSTTENMQPSFDFVDDSLRIYLRRRF